MAQQHESPNSPYLLVVRSTSLERAKKVPAYRIRFQEELYTVFMLYDDITAIGNDPTYVRIKGRRKDDAIILQNTKGELTPIGRLQGVVLKENFARKRQEKAAVAITTLKGKLKEYGITSAMQLIEHTGLAIAELGRHLGAREEINVLTEKSSAFLSNADLLHISMLLGWEYDQEIKDRFKNNSIDNCIVVYNMNIDAVVRQLGYLHRHIFMGYEFQRSKSAEEKKEDLITKLGYDLIEGVKMHLLQRHKISNSIQLLTESPVLLYESLTAAVINKVLKKDFIYKASEFTLEKRSSFCQKLGRIVEKDVYVYLCYTNNALENMYSAFGTNCTKFIEKQVKYLTDVDEAHERSLARLVAQYCQHHTIYFSKTDIVRRQFNFVLAMLLLGTGYTKNNNETITTQRPDITTLEKFAQQANAQLMAYETSSFSSDFSKHAPLQKNPSTHRALVRDTGQKKE